jgi:phage shock protein PspC (stress-responsive transcriptional regulator)
MVNLEQMKVVLQVYSLTRAVYHIYRRLDIPKTILKLILSLLTHFGTMVFFFATTLGLWFILHKSASDTHPAATIPPLFRLALMLTQICH